MISPSGFYRAFRLRRALPDYPQLVVPHPFRETELTRREALENYEFFLNVKGDRIDGMRAWFARHFRIDLSLTQEGVCSFSKWIDRHGTFVLAPFREHRTVWDTYNPGWTGFYRSLNLVYDTAIFYGDYVTGLFPDLRWSFFDEKPLVPGIRRQSYFRPTLGGLTEEGRIDPFKIAFDMYRLAAGQRTLQGGLTPIAGLVRLDGSTRLEPLHQLDHEARADREHRRCSESGILRRNRRRPDSDQCFDRDIAMDPLRHNRPW